MNLLQYLSRFVFYFLQFPDFLLGIINNLTRHLCNLPESACPSATTSAVFSPCYFLKLSTSKTYALSTSTHIRIAPLSPYHFANSCKICPHKNYASSYYPYPKYDCFPGLISPPPSSLIHHRDLPQHPHMADHTHQLHRPPEVHDLLRWLVCSADRFAWCWVWITLSIFAK